MKTALKAAAAISVLIMYFWYDNHKSHDWYREALQQAAEQHLVPLLGAENCLGDLTNPWSWLDPAPYEQWFIPESLVGADRTRNMKPITIQVVKLSAFGSPRYDFLVVYSLDRKSSVVLESPPTELDVSRLEFELNPKDTFHNELLELIAADTGE